MPAVSPCPSPRHQEMKASSLGCVGGGNCWLSGLQMGLEPKGLRTIAAVNTKTRK